jgi:hypothetical protein
MAHNFIYIKPTGTHLLNTPSMAGGLSCFNFDYIFVFAIFFFTQLDILFASLKVRE